MSRFLVKVTETRQKFIEVEAEDKEEAYDESWRRWNSSDPEFILTGDDFVDADFYVYDSDVE